MCGQRWSLRSGGVGDAEEQQALSPPRPLHHPLQRHRRNYQRDHQLCLAGNFQVNNSLKTTTT